MNIFFKITLLIILSIAFNKLLLAQENSCPASKDSDILLANVLLVNNELEEEREKLGIKKINYSPDSFDTNNKDFINNLEEFWYENSVSIIKDEAVCRTINLILAINEVEKTFPSHFKKTYFRVENKFMVVFLPDCGEGCIQMGGERLPTFIISEEQEIHELTRL